MKRKNQYICKPYNWQEYGIKNNLQTDHHQARPAQGRGDVRAEGELLESATAEKISVVQLEGSRNVNREPKLTEILYIFFGIHTANVVQLVGRIEQGAPLAVA